MKIIYAICGTLAGYLIAVLSLLVWFFRLTHHDPWMPASPGYIAATALFGIAASGIAGSAGATIARGWERGAGMTIGLLILLVCAWSWWETPGQAHWSQMVAIVLMAPAAVACARLLADRRPRIAAPTGSNC